MRTIALLFIVLLVAVPAAFAAVDTTTSDPARIGTAQTARSGPDVQTTANPRVVSTDEPVQRRVVAEQTVQERLRELHQARDAYQLRVQEYREDRADFLASKNALLRCRQTARTAQDCAQELQTTHDLAQRSLVGALDSVHNHLDRWEAKVLSSDALSQEEVDAMLARIEQMRTHVDAMREEAEAAETGADVNVVARKMGALMQAVHRDALRFEARYAGQAVLVALQRAERMQAQMRCTEHPAIDLTEFSAALERARLAFREARALYDQNELAASRSKTAEAAQYMRTVVREYQTIAVIAREERIRFQPCEVQVQPESFTNTDVEEELAQDGDADIPSDEETETEPGSSSDMDEEPDEEVNQ